MTSQRHLLLAATIAALAVPALSYAAEIEGKAATVKDRLAEQHNREGNALFDEGKWSESAAAYRAAIRLRPNVGTYYGNLSSALAYLGEYAEAEKVCKKGVEHAPEDAIIRCKLADALHVQKKYEEAAAEYRVAIELKPDEGKCHANLAGTLVRQGKRQEALRSAQEAKSLGLKEHWVFKNLGLDSSGKGSEEASMSRPNVGPLIDGERTGPRPGPSSAQEFIPPNIGLPPEDRDAQVLDTHRHTVPVSETDDLTADDGKLWTSAAAMKEVDAHVEAVNKIDAHVEWEIETWRDGNTWRSHYHGTLLHKAISHGHQDVVLYLLKMGADVNATGCGGKRCTWGETPLALAVELGHDDIARLLLSHGADPNLRGRYVDTQAPLQTATSTGNLEMLKLLVSEGAKLDADFGDHRDSLLVTAVRRGDLASVMWMTEQGLDVNTKSHYGRAVIEAAVSNGHVAVATFLLVKGATVPNSDDNILFDAVDTRDYGLVQLLLARGANVKHTHARYKDLTVLHVALQQPRDMPDRSGAIAVLLIQAGADVNAVAGFGSAPLHLALKNSREEIALSLLKLGADVNVRDERGRTALHYADDEYVVKSLLKAGADPTIRDNDGKTPLDFADSVPTSELLKKAMQHER